MKYMIAKNSEVLEMALNVGEKVLSAKANELFMADIDSFLFSFLENGLLASFARRVLAEGTNNKVVSRFASITQKVCLVNAAESIKSCSYVFSFLSLCHERSVYGVFEEFLSQQDEKPKGFLELIKEEFSARLLEAIGNLPDTLLEQNLVLACNLFRLVGLSVKNAITAPYFKEAKNVKKLLRSFKEPAQELLSTQWDAVCLSLFEDNVYVVNDSFASIIDMLSYPHDLLLPIHVTAINTIKTMCIYSKDFVAFVEDKEIDSKLVEIINQFPHHSIALNAISSLICTIPESPFKESLLKAVIPICEEFINKNDDVEMHAFSWDLLKKSKNNAQIGENTIATLKVIDEIADNEYGGALPSPDDNATDENQSFTQEQILQILRYLTSGGGMK